LPRQAKRKAGHATNSYLVVNYTRAEGGKSIKQQSDIKLSEKQGQHCDVAILTNNNNGYVAALEATTPAISSNENAAESAAPDEEEGVVVPADPGAPGRIHTRMFRGWH